MGAETVEGDAGPASSLDDRTEPAPPSDVPSGPRAHARRRHPAHVPKRRYRAVLFRRLSFGGLVIGLAAWWCSIYPTLLPRGWTAQAVVSGLCFSLGYLAGAVAGWLGHVVLHRLGRGPAPSVRRLAWRVLAAAAAGVVVLGAVFWIVWQNQQRALVSLGDLSPVVVPLMVLVSAVIAAVLFLIGRSFWYLVLAFDRFNTRFVPRPLAVTATVVVVVLVVFLLSRDVVFHGFFDWADDTFSVFNDTTPEGVLSPTSDAVSGSPSSLAPWSTLGYYGRLFVASATSEQDLRSADVAATVDEPIRVYAGLQTADDPDDRAAIVVKELQRTGAFDREVLAIVTTTGTGWVDPDAARAIEMLYAGDTAIAAMQYSYLPSWISFLVDRDKAAAAGRALYGAVHDAWSERPSGSRPKLLVFGVSLGSFGGEAPFAGSDVEDSVAQMTGGADALLFAGPTETNPVYRQLLAARAPGTPVWLPEYDGGRSVRFANRPSDIEAPFEGWDGTRVLYIHHPSDPVGYWNWTTLWSKPEWMDRPRGYDVPEGGPWVPVLTWVQTVQDLIAGFSAPPGYGHDYSIDYVAGLAAVLPPDGWTQSDTEALMQLLHTPVEQG